MKTDEMRLVAVTLFTAIDKSLTYGVSGEYSDDDLLGRRVIVPLGKKKQLGIITGVDVEYGGTTKAIESFPDLTPVLAKKDLELCRFISDYYFASLSETMQSMLPKGLTERLNQKIVIVDPDRLAGMAREGDKDAMQLSQIAGGRKVILAARVASIQAKIFSRFEAERVIQFQWDLPEKKKFDAEYVVTLVGETTLPARLGEPAKRAIAFLEKRGETNLYALRKALKLQRPVIDRLTDLGLINIAEKPPFIDRASLAESPSFELNAAQTSAINQIKDSIISSKFAPFLLHGVTGSGKTEVYIEAIKVALAAGKNAIIIVPEIGLSQAIYYRLSHVFSGRIALLHSQLTPRSRLEIWQKAKAGKIGIVLGPRSALFTPFPRLGVIVVDEEHDHSLKQGSPAPHYHARDVAVYRAQLEDCAVILGSATPSLESYHNALTGKYKLLELPHRVDGRVLPKVTRVNLMESLMKKGFTYLSEALVERIKWTIARGGQVMLLLNRRGFAPSVHCFECGTKLECQNCAVSLVYHKARNCLLCHQCGSQQPYKRNCAKCGCSLYLFKGIGTEKLEEELRQNVHGVPTTRLDYDSTRLKGSFQEIYHRFKSGKAKILVGTQMIAKGFDFPDVALMGIVSADTTLEFPDFRAREKTFQLLTQASGRAGRLNFPGEVILQTLHPEDKTIALACEQDYKSFYEIEIKERHELDFPPFSHLIMLEIQSPDEKLAESKAGELRRKLGKMHNRLFRLLGPIPAPILRRKSVFRFHLLLKTRRVKMTLSFLGPILDEKEFRSSPKMRVIVDVDAVDMM